MKQTPASAVSARQNSSKRVQLLLQADLHNPSPSEQDTYRNIISKLSLEECERLSSELRKKGILKPPYPLASNKLRRVKRANHYVETLKEATAPFLQKLGRGSRFCDIGCGTGVITMGILGAYIKRGGIVYGCDVTNYLDESLKKDIEFTSQDTLQYLKEIDAEYFDGIMAVVMLHHLPSKAKVKKCIKEMIRVTKPPGLVILVETVHHTWYELLKNAVLDKLLNERTNKELQCQIPTPLSLLSDDEIRTLLQENNLAILKKSHLSPIPADPKFHNIYICRKMEKK